VAAVVRFLRLPQQTAAGDDLMAYRMRVHELDTGIGARRELAAELRDLADRLDSQEPDYSALHDAWEVLVDLADQVQSLRVQFFSRHPEQEAWLIEKRPWLDPRVDRQAIALSAVEGRSTEEKTEDCPDSCVKFPECGLAWI
jgi:hypothetical protein